MIDGGWLKKGEQNNNDGMFGAVVYTLLSTKNIDTGKTRHEEIPTRENTDTENFRHGENPTQYNKDNKENKVHPKTHLLNKEKKTIKKKKINLFLRKMPMLMLITMSMSSLIGCMPCILLNAQKGVHTSESRKKTKLRLSLC